MRQEPLHLTLKYRLTDNSEVVFHAYLNAKGEYLRGTQTLFDTITLVTQEQKMALKQHIKNHKPFLDALLQEQKNRAKDRKATADKLDRKLTTLSKTLNLKESREIYLQIAHEFIKAVQAFNQYSEIKDKRDKGILRLFKNIQTLHDCSQNETKTAEPIAVVLLDSDEAYVLPENNSINELRDKVMSNIIELARQFKNTDSDKLKNLKLKNEVADELNEQFFIAYSFPLGVLTDDDLSRIQSITLELEKHYDEQCLFLQAKALENDFNAVQLIFPFVKKHLGEKFYLSLMEEPKVDLLKIYDFLNTHDLNYREYIYHLTQTKTFILPKEIRKLILDEQYMKGYEVQASFLFMLYIQNQESIFSLFLNHGACANSWGIRIMMGSYSPTPIEFSIFNCIVVTSSTQQDNVVYPYLKSLLNHQANPNEIYLIEKLLRMPHTQVKIGQRKRRILSSMLDGRGFPCERLAARSGTEGLKLILDKGSVFSLSYTMACCLTGSLHKIKDENNIITMILNHCYGFEFKWPQKEGQSKVRVPSGNQRIFVYYYIFPCLSANNRVTHMECYNEIIEKTALIQPILTQKIIQLSDEDFEKEYGELCDQGAKFFNKHDFGEAYVTFVGCEFFLMTRCFSLYSNREDQIDFLNHYLEDLYTNLIYTTEQLKAFPQMEAYKASAITILNWEKTKKLEQKTAPAAILHMAPKSQILATTGSIIAICQAAREGALEQLVYLLNDFKGNINEAPANAKGWTALHYACKFNNIDCAKKLIASGASLETKNDKGFTPRDLLKDEEAIKRFEAFLQTPHACSAANRP